MVGLWTSKDDPGKSLERLMCEGAVHLVTSIGAAVAEIHQMVQPLLLQRERAAADAAVALEKPG